VNEGGKGLSGKKTRKKYSRYILILKLYICTHIYIYLGIHICSWRHSTARLVLRAGIAPSPPRFYHWLPRAARQICPTATQHAFQNQCVRVSLYVCWRMLTCADVCWRVLTYADVCWRMLTSADVCWRLLTFADVCWRMLKYAVVCWRVLTCAHVSLIEPYAEADVCWCMLTCADACWRMLSLTRVLLEAY
jgi:hypothetical protein